MRFFTEFTLSETYVLRMTSETLEMAQSPTCHSRMLPTCHSRKHLSGIQPRLWFWIPDRACPRENGEHSSM